jgi:hypothetical protein
MSEIFLSGTYGGPHATLADPATEAGIALKAYQSLGVWKADDTRGLIWQIAHPAQFIEVTATGVKYRYTSDWPSFMLIATWVVLFTEATPSAAQTWESLSAHSAVTIPYNSVLGMYAPYLQFVVQGTINGLANNMAAMEFQGVTLTMRSAWVMQYLAISAENSSFYMDSTIANSTTGEAISLTLPMEINKILVIDCDAETIVYDGMDIGLPLNWNTVRGPWLDLAPGANTLTFTDTGTIPGLNIDISWEDRNTL